MLIKGEDMKTPWPWLFGLIVFTVLPAAAETTILVLGDSLTAGYGLTSELAFPAQLEAALVERGHHVRVVNAGISGDTSAGGAARLEWSLAEQPDIVIVELGANDALRGLSPAQTRKQLAAILERLKREQVDVLLAGMKAPVTWVQIIITALTVCILIWPKNLT